MRLNVVARRRRPLALTALVDVVFILLFFFMLAAQTPSWQSLGVALAPVEAAGPQAEASSASVVVVLDADGRFTLGDRVLTLGDLQQHLAAFTPGPQVVLVPGPSVPVQALVTAVEALAAAGVPVRLGLPAVDAR